MHLRKMVTTVERSDASGRRAITISTCYTVDCGWETALFYCNSHRSEVLEHYDNENEAIKGHLKHATDYITR